MTGLMYLKELILIRQMHQKNVIFVTTGILKILVLMQKAMNCNDVAIVSVKGND